eukprot:365811-Chlamydomonas_euryale.AAC.15
MPQNDCTTPATAGCGDEQAWLLTHLRSMAAEVDEELVAVDALCYELTHLVLDVGTRGLDRAGIGVQHHRDVRRAEPCERHKQPCRGRVVEISAAQQDSSQASLRLVHGLSCMYCSAAPRLQLTSLRLRAVFCA